jgi:peptidoglycan/xylan/chitin deacetylase (PgdA/CDA1 family)
MATGSWRAWVKQTALRTGTFAAAARLRAASGAAVLCYHGVRPEIDADPRLPFAGLHVPTAYLAQHLDVIRRIGRPVSLGQLLDGLAGRQRLPPRAVHVTFDDGYRSVMTRALPLLERADVPASVFVSRRPIERRSLFWFDGLSRARGDEAAVAARDHDRPDWKALVDEWSTPAPDGDELATLTSGQVATLASHPLLAIGSHTDTHPPLAQLAPADQRAEIVRGIDAVEAWTGRRPIAFAYPVGRPDRDFDASTVALVAECGVQAAFTTAPGRCTRLSPILSLPRFVAVDGWDGAELAYRLSVAWRS